LEWATYVYRFSNLLGLVTHTFCPITLRFRILNIK